MAGPSQNTLHPIIFHQNKTQFLIQLLPPKQVDAVIANLFFLPIKFQLCLKELLLMGMEEFLQMDGIPFLCGPSPSRFSGAGFFISNAVTFCFCLLYGLDMERGGHSYSPTGKYRYPSKHSKGNAPHLHFGVNAFSYHPEASVLTPEIMQNCLKHIQNRLSAMYPNMTVTLQFQGKKG